jgi:S-formylglutathione hydrolase FrmB
MAVLQFSFYSTCLRRLVPVSAVVPVEEGAPSGKPIPAKLPTVYMLHGYSGICTDWLYGASVAELAQRHGFAVFCPSGENSFYLDDADGGCNYATFVAKELVQFTRRLFPLSDKKEDTAIAGFSMGGYGALRNGLHYDDTFGAVFAFSSALFMDRLAAMKPGESDFIGNTTAYFERWFGNLSQLPGSDKDPAALAQNYIARHNKLPLMYTACGTEDFGVDGCRKYGELLTKLDPETKYEEWQGEHNWKFWDAAIEKAFKWWDEKRA